jgi:DNA-binding CsgD family transcriptional regulator
MGLSADDDLLDLVYATVLDRAQWVPLMERFADRIGGGASALTRIDLQTGAGEAITSRSDPESERAYHEYFGARNVLTIVRDVDDYLQGWSHKVLTDADCLPRDEFVRTEFYADYFRRWCGETAMFIRLAVSEQEVTCVNIGRPAHRGAFDVADLEFAARLQPHLIRAHALSRSFAEARATQGGGLAALDGADRAYLIVDEESRIREANTAAHRLLAEGDVLASVGGRLTARDRTVRRELESLLAAATSRDRGRRQGGSAAAPSAGRVRPLVLAVTPLNADDAGAFAAGRNALVSVTDLEAAPVPPAEELRRLFGLTAAEARVALALYEGLTIRDIADAFGVSRHTVRFQIARAHEKAGVSRQAELVRLIARLAGATGRRA